MTRNLTVILFLFVMGCDSGKSAPCTGLLVDFEGQPYCAYTSAAITEEGFRCPRSMPFRFDFDGASACGESGDLPEGLEEFIESLTASVDAGTPEPDGGQADAGMQSDVTGQDATPQDAAQVCEDALEPNVLTGTSPIFPIEMTLAGFVSQDCLTISQAFAMFEAAGGERLTVAFSYPVVEMSGTRSVSGAFERQAQLSFTDASGTTTALTDTVFIEVTSWTESSARGTGHILDITLRIDGNDVSTDTVTLRGTFCEWSWLLC